MRSVIFFFKVILYAIFFYYGICKVSAQNSYAYADIPEAMKKNANAVVISDHREITIESDGKFYINVKKAVCILNQNGIDEAIMTLPYNKFIKVNSFSAKLFNASGVNIKRRDMTEMKDYGYIEGNTLYSDYRYKKIAVEWNEYPFFVEFEFSFTILEGISYPGWNPVSNYNVSVMRALLFVNKQESVSLRYLEKNINNTCKKSIVNNSVYSWELKNFQALINEPFSNGLYDLAPYITFSPSVIDYDGYVGNLNSWKDFGKWTSTLLVGTDELPISTINTIHSLTSGLENNRTKIKAVYEYVQSHTRYVNVVEGIGGFKPIAAKDVDRLGYGDCKALSNYTKALLSAIGIKSYYTRIGAGEAKPPFEIDFVSHQFNHIILCVPDEKDTIWLECTSQISPFNYLGDFTSGRPALLITEDGGVLVNTPEFHSGKCERTRKINLELDETGSGVASVKTTYSGIHYDDYVPMLVKDKESRKKAIAEGIRIPKFELLDFSISEFKIENPYADEYLEIFVNTLFTNAGIKKIMQTNLMSRLDRNPFTGRERMTDINISWPYKAIDTINYKLPKGFTPDKLPKPFSLTGDFASYSNETTYKDGILQYVRVLEIVPGTYPKERYAEFTAFFDKVVSSDAMKIALIKPE